MAEKRKNLSFDDNKNVKKKGQVFIESYKSIPFITHSVKGPAFAKCIVCFSDFSIVHGGIYDIKKHCARVKHISNAEAHSNQPQLLFKSKDDHRDDVIRAEVLFTEFLIKHNIAHSVADDVSLLFKKMFPDSAIAKQYKCGGSKTKALADEMALINTEALIEKLKVTPFALATDGSNDTEHQLYPLIVRCYDLKESPPISWEVLNVPECVNECTGENIYNLIHSSFIDNSLSYDNLLAVSVDNTNVMVGSKKGVYGRIMNNNSNIFLGGCLCHLINLAIKYAAAKLEAKVDELLIDIFYYLEKSHNRKHNLKSYQEFCCIEQLKVLKHCCTRWLSLGTSLTRLIE